MPAVVAVTVAPCNRSHCGASFGARPKLAFPDTHNLHL